MNARALLVALVLSTLTLAGCTEAGDGVTNFECRTRTINLEVGVATNGNHNVYTLNDGATQMPVVAMGFQPIGGKLEFPNTQIRVNECDTVEITVQNNNPLPHTFHLHGGIVDWKEDGVPFISQLPIHQGEERTYTFKDMKAGTYWYHCHVDVAHHIDLGMYGAFIVEEQKPSFDYDFDLPEHVLMLDEWDNCHVHGSVQEQQTVRENNGGITFEGDCQERKFQDTYSQGGLTSGARQSVCDTAGLPQEVYDTFDCMNHAAPPPGTTPRSWYPMTFPVYAPEYNTYTINGKAFPDTAPITLEEGKTYRWRLINVGEEMHSMHIHGHNFLVTHRDGYELPNPFRVDTLGIMPGERYDVLMEANNPGLWVFHDHVGLSDMNDHQSPGGMLTVLAYKGAMEQEIGYDASAIKKAGDYIWIGRDYHMEHSGEHGHTLTNRAHQSENLVVGSDRVYNA